MSQARTWNLVAGDACRRGERGGAGRFLVHSSSSSSRVSHVAYWSELPGFASVPGGCRRRATSLWCSGGRSQMRRRPLSSGSPLNKLVRCVPSRSVLSGFGATELHPTGRGGEGENRCRTGCLAFEPLLAGRGGEGERRWDPRSRDWRGARWRALPKLAGSLRRLLMVVYFLLGFFISVSKNKSDGSLAASTLLEMQALCAVNSSLAGRGGEGRGRSGPSAGASVRCWSCHLLHNRAEHAAAMVAAVIFGRKGGPSERRISVSSTSKAEAFPGVSRRSS